MTGGDITLREYVEKLVTDRDRLCNTRMDALSKQLVLRVDTLEDYVKQVFATMDKAVVKAESAQKDYKAYALSISALILSSISIILLATNIFIP